MYINTGNVVVVLDCIVDLHVKFAASVISCKTEKGGVARVGAITVASD